MSSQIDVVVSTEPNAGDDGVLEICINENPVDLLDSLLGSPDLGGIWSPSLASGTGLFNPLLDVSGTYTYTVNNGICGSDTASVIVTITDLFPIDDYVINVNDFSDNNSIEIIVNSNFNYEYSLDGINYQSTNTFSNLIPDVYSVFVREIDGCGKLEESVFVLNLPTFFTPNNDDKNDYWGLGVEINQEYSLIIFDRYGKTLTTLNNNVTKWSGTFNGNILPSNDYWYTISFKSSGFSKSGHFTLKR